MGRLHEFAGDEAGHEPVSLSVIVKNPKILGTCVSRKTRVPPCETLDEFLEHFPSVTREAAIRALERAKTSLVGQLE